MFLANAFLVIDNVVVETLIIVIIVIITVIWVCLSLYVQIMINIGERLQSDVSVNDFIDLLGVRINLLTTMRKRMKK